MWQLVEILDVFNVVTLKQILWKTKTFFKNWSAIFQLKALKLKKYHSHTKLPYQKPMLRQIEWWVQNGPITKNQVFPVTNWFFWKLCFGWGTSYKELIWCTNDPDGNMCTFSKRCSFIWRCSFSVSILKTYESDALLPRTINFIAIAFN